MGRYISTFAFILCLSLTSWAQGDQGDQAASSGNARIIGGSPASIINYNYAAQIVTNGAFNCGGSLISRRCVLSAAHCFVDEKNPTPNAAIVTVRLGSELRLGGQEYRVREVEIHPQYNMRTQQADLAIVVMRNNVTLSNTIGLGSIAGPALMVPDDSVVTHIGWGQTIPGVATSGSNVLLAASVQVVPQAVCMAAYAPLGYLVSNDMICAGLYGLGGADACQGDSGGPLLYQNVIVGVTSWGEGCADPRYPGVSVRISPYSNWIVAAVTRHNGSSAINSSAIILLFGLVTVLLTKS